MAAALEGVGGMELADAVTKVWIRGSWREGERERERERERGTDFVRLSESAVSAEAQLPPASHLWASR